MEKYSSPGSTTGPPGNTSLYRLYFFVGRGEVLSVKKQHIFVKINLIASRQ